MEGKSLIYAPSWVKAISIFVLACALGSSIALAVYYVGQEDREDWILLSMSLAQVAASGLVLGLVVFFSERDVNVLGLQKRCERFLLKTLPEAFLLIDYPLEGFEDFQEGKRRSISRKTLLRKSRTKIKVAHSSGSISSFYRINALNEELNMLVKANIWELVVSYYFPVTSVEESNSIRETMEWAFAGYTELDNFHMSWNVDSQAFDGTEQKYAAFHFKKEYGKEFLEDGRAQAFFAQMVTALTRSLIREAKNKGVALVRR